MFEQAWKLFRTDIALDIGSQRTRIVVQDHGLAFDEPTLVVTELHRNSEQIVAFGNAAKQYEGKTPPTMRLYRPVINSICANPSILEQYIRLAVQKAIGGSSFLRPKILMVMPHGLSSQERKTYIDILYHLGNRESIFVDTLLCAGLGCKLPINEPTGSFLLHMGHGSSQLGVLTLSGLAASKRTSIAGQSINQGIVDHLKETKNIEISLATAMDLKQTIGHAEKPSTERSAKVMAKQLTTAQFQSLELQSSDITEGIQKVLLGLVDTVRKTVSTLSPELCADIIHNGLMLSGASAQLTGIDDFFSENLKLPVFIADQPHLTPLKGAGGLLNNADLLDWLGEESG